MKNRLSSDHHLIRQMLATNLYVYNNFINYHNLAK